MFVLQSFITLPLNWLLTKPQEMKKIYNHLNLLLQDFSLRLRQAAVKRELQPIPVLSKNRVGKFTNS